MHVIFATGIFPPDIGGPANSVALLAEAWSARGHRVTVVTYADRTEGDARTYEVRRIPRTLPAWRRVPAFLVALWRVTREPGPIFAQDGVATGLPAWMVARLRRRRLIVRIAGDFAWERAQVTYGYRESLETFQHDRRLPAGLRFARALQHFVYRQADRVVAPSRYLAGVVESWGVPSGRISTVYNGVEPPEFSARSAVHPHRIVTAGRLVPWKHFDLLIKAMPRIRERVPDATLLIAGDGPELERLRALASAPLLEDSVSFVGRLERKALLRLVSESGIFALASSYEGFSHQLVEAAACGAPIVATRAGGNAELIVDGKNGLLVDPEHVDALADALLRFLEDPAFARDCGQAGKDSLAPFAIDRQIEKTAEAVFGAPGLRVVLVSRDPTAADPASRTAARMRAYGTRVARLHLVCLAREAAVAVDLSVNVRVEVVDVRTAIFRPRRLSQAVTKAARSFHANLIVAQDPFEAGVVARSAARRLDIPLLVEEHGGVFLSSHWREERFRNRLLFPLGLAVLKRAAGVRTVSVKIEEDLRRRFPDMPLARVPVSTEPRQVRSSAAPDVFGCIARFVSQKNHPMLLEAFAAVRRRRPSARLILAGAGPLETSLKARASALGLDGAVEWVPHHEAIDAVYARIGTFVLPSWYEGWGRVIPEAMACGIPVVMTDVGCARELPRNGVEGYIVPVGDADLLAKAMLEICEPGRHALMAAAARRRAETMPGPDELADRLVVFWKTVAGA